MQRCPICAASDTPGWVDDGAGAEMPCPKCTLGGEIHGSGYMQGEGTPVPIQEAPDYLGSVIAQVCPHCEFRNVISGWDSLIVFTCRRCLRWVEVRAERVH